MSGRLLRIFLITIAVLAPAPALAQSDRYERRDMTLGGLEREYFIHAPANIPANRSLPLMLVLHGGGAETAEGLRTSYGFKPLVEKGAFIAVYPSAHNKAWAMGGAPTADRANPRPDHDDVAFLDAVLADVIDDHPVDTSRLFVSGASRGGSMTQWYVPRSQYRFAGAGTVITSMVRSISEGLQFPRPMTWVMMIGDNDPFMPYDGRAGAERRDDLLPVEEIVGVINAANGLTGAPDRVGALGNPDGFRSCGNELREWSSSETGAKTAIVRVLGGSHVMFGSWQCKDFQHADEMWRYFEQAQLRPQSLAADPAPAQPTPRGNDTPASTGAPDRFFYGVEAFTIVSTQTGTESGTVTEYARSWGLERSEVFETSVQRGMRSIEKRERKVYRSGRVTTINARNGRSRSANAPFHGQVLEASQGRRPEDAGALIMAAVGGTATGETGRFAGHDCTYYENRAIGSTICVTDWGGTLHLRVRFLGADYERTATEVRLGDGGPDSAFALGD